MNKILQSIASFFPSNRGKWINYIKTSLPVILAAFIYALNSFVDNFMATFIKSGNQALSYANTWTTIVNGIIAATTVIGSSLYGQYYGTNNILKIQQVIRGRMIIALGITFLFIIPVLINARGMMHLASGFDSNVQDNILNIGADYLRIIGISWIFSTWGYTIAMILRESGYGFSTMISSIICLAINILLNTIFIIYFENVLWPLAISTIISLLVGSILYFSIYIWKKDKRLTLNFIKIFNISKDIWKQFLIRIPSFLLYCTSSLTVSIRYIFWNFGYPVGSIPLYQNPNDYEISAANILGISGMFFSIFWNTFESINANVTLFVGKELGNNNYKKAKENAKELQGFHFCISVIMSLMLLALSFLITKMNFLAKGYKDGLLNSQLANEGSIVLLENIKMTIWPLSWYMPFWIWFITKSRIISSGGRTNITGAVDAIVGVISISWISIINFTNIHYNIEFPWAYALFFVPDLVLKLITYEILYYKIQWAKNITLESFKK